MRSREKLRLRSSRFVPFSPEPSSRVDGESDGEIGRTGCARNISGGHRFQVFSAFSPNGHPDDLPPIAARFADIPRTVGWRIVRRFSRRPSFTVRRSTPGTVTPALDPSTPSTLTASEWIRSRSDPDCRHRDDQRRARDSRRDVGPYRRCRRQRNSNQRREKARGHCLMDDRDDVDPLRKPLAHPF